MTAAIVAATDAAAAFFRSGSDDDLRAFERAIGQVRRAARDALTPRGSAAATLLLGTLTAHAREDGS